MVGKRASRSSLNEAAELLPPGALRGIIEVEEDDMLAREVGRLRDEPTPRIEWLSRREETRSTFGASGLAPIGLRSR